MANYFDTSALCRHYHREPGSDKVESVLAEAGSTHFVSWLMSVIDTQRFAELGDVWSRRKPSPGLAELCEISFQMANSYRVLHLRGMCYRDISRGNLMFDSRTGEVLICDNDNVGINRHSVNGMSIPSQPTTWPRRSSAKLLSTRPTRRSGVCAI